MRIQEMSNKKLFQLVAEFDHTSYSQDSLIREVVTKKYANFNLVLVATLGVEVSKELVKRIKMIHLADKIHNFIDEYGQFAADNEEGEHYYKSGDANWLNDLADMFKAGIYHNLNRVGSSYLHGGYKKSKVGEKIHDEIVSEVFKILNSVYEKDEKA